MLCDRTTDRVTDVAGVSLLVVAGIVHHVEGLLAAEHWERFASFS